MKEIKITYQPDYWREWIDESGTNRGERVDIGRVVIDAPGLDNLEVIGILYFALANLTNIKKIIK